MNQAICDAVRNKQRIEFIYNGKIRVGEPQCYGISSTNKEVLRVHLIKGGSRPEQLFECAKISSLRILNEKFERSGPNYRKGDSAMKIIFCEL